MDLIEDLGYVCLGVPDLDAAALYLSEVCRLAVTERDERKILLTGNEREYWIRLEEAPTPRLVRLGFRASSQEALEVLRSRLHDSHVDEVRNSDVPLGSVCFSDPEGRIVEVYLQPQEQTPGRVREVPNDAGLDILLHAVVSSSDPLATSAFYEDLLGFRRSDRISDLVVFLRAGNKYHHCVAFAKGPPGKLDHFAVLTRDLDAVMRMRNHGIATGTLSGDVVRHAASGSVSVYLRDDATDIAVEFCTDHGRITDDTYRGRVLVPSPSTVDVWSDPFPLTDWKAGVRQRSGATEAARTASGETSVSN